MRLETAELKTLIGPLALVVRDGRLCRLEFDGRWSPIRRQMEDRFGTVEWVETADPAGVVTQLKNYLAGDLRALDAIRVDTDGTPFQEEVWRALRKIRPGRTLSYGDLAKKIGRPRAVRAVGTANGSNPVAIVVPCHRVIGSDGKLTGYGGGLNRKEWLLRHESAVFRPETKGRRQQSVLPFAAR